METQAGKRILVACYSLSGETLGEGWSIVNVERGFTSVAAEFVCEAVGGELFQIETQEPYPESHRIRVAQSRDEIKDGIKPALKGMPADFDTYGTVFLCFPVWWLTIPPAVATFVTSGDWRGKRIIPLSTSHSSGSADSVAALRELCAGTVEDGAEILGQQVYVLGPQLQAWAKAQLGGE